MKRVHIIFMSIILAFSIGCAQKDNTITEIKPLKKENLVNSSTIHDAVRINDLELVKYFVKEGIDINSKDKFGYTPLHLAARFNHLKIAQFLIDNKANVNTQDKYLDSPLLDSTRNGYSKMSELLICSGADRSIADKYKLTPYKYALSANDIRLTKLLKMEDLSSFCNKKEEKNLNSSNIGFKGPSITVDDNNVIKEAMPIICGDILDPSVLQVQVSLDEGKSVYDANLDMKNKRWCAKVSNHQKAGEYKASVISMNKSNKMTRVEDKFKIAFDDIIITFLKKEFENEFEKWNLELLADSYTIRFKDSSMFLRGKNEISDEYKKIFNQFFPRYLAIISKNIDKINTVSIQGHTPSRYRTAKTQEEKFEKNRILSQKRADTVLAYLKGIENITVYENKDLIKDFFISEGKASSELIYNQDGTENIKASRRVEFKINLK
jgi:flagellar motor protein MotB